MWLVSTPSGFAPFSSPDWCRGLLEDWLPDRGQPQEVQQPRGVVLRKGLHLGRKPKPILTARAAHREGAWGHSPLSAPTGDLSIEGCITAASLMKYTKCLLWWDVWITGGFWVPPEQRLHCQLPCIQFCCTPVGLLLLLPIFKSKLSLLIRELEELMKKTILIPWRT